jgi:hypothetical protein
MNQNVLVFALQQIPLELRIDEVTYYPISIQWIRDTDKDEPVIKPECTCLCPTANPT